MVAAVSVAWVVLGPVNIDDSWYLLMSRNAMRSGYLGNAIYQFNVTENPFPAGQYVMQAWGGLAGNWSLGWMRLVPLGYGLATYALLGILVATVLGRPARARVVPWAVAAAHRVAAVLLTGAAASVVVPVVFADATLGDVLESVAVHRWYYTQFPWYAEYLHYENVFVGDERGAWGKRLPVLLTLAVLLAVALGVGRRAGTAGRRGQLLGSTATVTTLSLIAMALTPTKWVNHFGAVAASAAALLAAAMIRSPLPRRTGAAVTAIGSAGLVAAAAVAFAGPNLWRPLLDWGQPFGDPVNPDAVHAEPAHAGSGAAGAAQPAAVAGRRSGDPNALDQLRTVARSGTNQNGLS